MLSNFTIGFIDDFFPSLSKLLQDTSYYANYKLATCHAIEEVTYFYGLVIRNYTLLPIQLIGLFVGLYGAFKLQHVQSWSWAFLYFSGMNLTSILCHNLSQKYSQIWIISRLLDVVFTGASSLCLVCTSIRVPRFIHPLIFVLLLFLNYMLPGVQFLSEFTYIGTIFMATMIVGPRLNKIGKSRVGYWLSLFGLAIIAASLLLDSFLCSKFGGLVASIHLVFLGCDVAFLGLLILVISSTRDIDHGFKKFQ